jgi:hypothetical protein
MICKKTLQIVQEDQRFYLKNNNESWNSQSGADDR